VIVIDDEAAIRQGMHELLSQWGCTSLEAPSAALALAVLSAQNAVPGSGAGRLPPHARQQRSSCRPLLRERFGAALSALLITGDTGPERLREAKETGAARAAQTRAARPTTRFV
jgi:CheY-like chemotaxis protein